MASSTEEPKCFEEVCIVLRAGISSSELDTSPKEFSHKRSRGIDPHVLGSNVVLEPCTARLA